jgi:hypothetical protein
MSSLSLGRRNFLQLSSACSLSFLLPHLDLKAAEKRGAERPKSLIVLWMSGGPSQLETFDPHPGLSQVESIKTRISGLQIADLLPQMADEIQHLNVVRSMVSKEGDHERGTYLLKTGYRPDPTLRHPTLGAIVEHELPANGVEIPRHVTLGSTEYPSWGGFLGAEHDAFKVYDPGRELYNMQHYRPDESQKRRMENLSVLERNFSQGRKLQTKKTLHQDAINRALQMMSSKQLKAFKIDTESEATRAAYGDSAFGRGCLVARRLVEEGVRAIEVSLNGWDSHALNLKNQSANIKVLDPAFATLIKDLRERDLLQSTVVLWIGEFGRTPVLNPADGRDHWPLGFSSVVGGGGLKSGVVLGATDSTNEKKAPENPVEVADLYATILQTLGVEYGKEVITPIGRPMTFSSGKPIAKLLG